MQSPVVSKSDTASGFGYFNSKLDGARHFSFPGNKTECVCHVSHGIPLTDMLWDSSFQYGFRLQLTLAREHLRKPEIT